ncbi:MAG TPA: nucleotide sugar dehydrogenase [Terriglobia bacterium]|nr:nucleotide sugar dehydrogenase [Terriglobia bacterium]
MSTSVSDIRDHSDRSLAATNLRKRIEAGTAHIGVLGLGYVGLPLAMTFERAGFNVVGMDLNGDRVAALANGESYVAEVDPEHLRTAMAAGRFVPTTHLDIIEELDCISICVPTPLRKTKDPDLSYVISAAEAIASRLHSEQLIILESTTYPGTTEEILLPRFEQTSLRAGEDFFLAYSPERVDPGNAKYHTGSIPKIIAGVTPACTDMASLLYGRAMAQVITVSSTRIAEMVKLLENTFRAVNIGLVNEIAMMCSHMGLDVWEVIRAASTKPFGFMPFYPGPGLGGHCIPIDPLYLQWKARLTGFEPRFIDLADKINQEMPKYVVIRTMELLNDHNKPLRGARVRVLGITYKKDVNDVRESPALEIITMLRHRGAEVSYTDPFAPTVAIDGDVLESQPLDRSALEKCDIALIVTDHSQFDYRQITNAAPLVFDTRNATQGISADHIVRL